MVVESHRLRLVNAISSKVRGRSNFYLIFDDIVHASRMLNTMSWSFVRSNGNKIAHELAHCLS